MLIKVPLIEMIFDYNGGDSNINQIINAFDEDEQTCWLSHNNNTIHNFIKISFSKSITINRLIYKSKSNQKGYGYPSELKIYYKFEYSKDTSDFLLIDDIICVQQVIKLFLNFLK